MMSSGGGFCWKSSKPTATLKIVFVKVTHSLFVPRALGVVMFLSCDQGTSFRKFRIIYRWSDLTVQSTQQGKYKEETSSLIISVWDMLKQANIAAIYLFP